MTLNKTTLLASLEKFARQRPGLEFGNYGDVKSYRSELRSITKDLATFNRLLSAVTWRDSITAEQIIAESKHAFGGRLTITPNGDGFDLDYCAGQYWPTEYRRAACAVLAAVLWDYWRTNAPVDAGPTERHSNLQNVGDYIHKTARKEFGRGIASTWFN